MNYILILKLVSSIAIELISEPWLFATASLDGTVKLWDTRQMKNNESSFLHSLPNLGPINSSFFR